MTGPRQDDGSGFAFTPAARRDRTRAGRGAAASPLVDDEQADLERGRTTALLAALGRMQLRLDVLAREQREGLAALQSAVEGVERRVAAVEAGVRLAVAEASRPPLGAPTTEG